MEEVQISWVIIALPLMPLKLAALWQNSVIVLFLSLGQTEQAMAMASPWPLVHILKRSSKICTRTLGVTGDA